jgi:predicted dehydrogenase
MQVSKSPLRLGVIGAGLWAAAKHCPAITEDERTVLTAVCRRDTKKLAMIQERFGASEAYTDWREMLERSEIDAAVVSTPHDLHAEPTIAALERGLHVMVEKPLATTPEDARAMVAASSKSGAVLMTTFNHRFSGLWRTAKEELQLGTIGTVRQVSLQVSTFRHFYWEEKSFPDRWRKLVLKLSAMPDEFHTWDLSDDWRSSRERTGGGTFVNFAAHGLDLALWLSGSQPAEVAAFTAPEGQEVEYFVCVASRLANDVQLSVTFADAAEGADQFRVMVLGDDGVLSFDRTDGAGVRIRKGGETKELAPRYQDVTPVSAFADCILDGAPNLVPAEDGANSVYLVDGVYKAAAGGKVWRP